MFMDARRNWAFVRRSVLGCAGGRNGMLLLALLAFVVSGRQELLADDEADGAIDISLADPKLPPPLKAYKGREIAQTMHYEGAPWLIRDSREREEDCTNLLEALHVKPGQTICDMGCGNGFYALKMAKFVGDTGTVIGVDIQPEMLRMFQERAKQENVKNFKTIQGSPIDPRLPPQSVDLILLVDVYHEFAYPEQMLSAMHKSLKPGGRIALAEFRREDKNVPIKLLHKMTKKQILKEYQPAGYKLVEQFDKLPWQHLMFFMRDDDPAAKSIDATEEN
jgi:ubiquinone/menaquinone biosynthesis C-methylase UbiE